MNCASHVCLSSIVARCLQQIDMTAAIASRLMLAVAGISDDATIEDAAGLQGTETQAGSMFSPTVRLWLWVQQSACCS